MTNSEGKSYSSALIDIKMGLKVYRACWEPGKYVVKHPHRNHLCMFIGGEHVGNFRPSNREQFAEDWFVVQENEEQVLEELIEEEG